MFPEFLTWRDVSDDLVRWTLAWLDDSEARARTTASLLALRKKVARPGASDRAAEHIVAWLQRRAEKPVDDGGLPLSSYHGPHEVRSHYEPADQSGPRL